MLKLGDRVKYCGRDREFDRGDTYIIDRIRGDQVILAYEDGYVPRNLRGRWLPMAKFRKCLARPIFKPGDLVKIVDGSGLEPSLFRRAQMEPIVGMVMEVVGHHYRNIDLVQIRHRGAPDDIPGYGWWLPYTGIKLYTPRQLPDWF